jgi:hypothetical protein
LWKFFFEQFQYVFFVDIVAEDEKFFEILEINRSLLLEPEHFFDFVVQTSLPQLEGGVERKQVAFEFFEISLSFFFINLRLMREEVVAKIESEEFVVALEFDFFLLAAVEYEGLLHETAAVFVQQKFDFAEVLSSSVA